MFVITVYELFPGAFQGYIYIIFSQIHVKVYSESHRGKESEPAGLCGLRKQVTEEEKGLMQLLYILMEVHNLLSNN